VRVESAFRAVLLRDVSDTAEPACKCHACDVDGRHLGRKHRLELIPRLNTFDDRQHEIEPALVELLIVTTCVGELDDHAV
jgi:hypothetical protein